MKLLDLITNKIHYTIIGVTVITALFNIGKEMHESYVQARIDKALEEFKSLQAATENAKLKKYQDVNEILTLEIFDRDREIDRLNKTINNTNNDSVETAVEDGLAEGKTDEEISNAYSNQLINGMWSVYEGSGGPGS